MIEAERVGMNFPGTEVLRDITFKVREGGSLAIIGPSGCGKTTLLYILAGLTAPTSGMVWIDGDRVHRPSDDMAFILQDHGLLPWRTVEENICLGMKLRRLPQEDMRKRAETVIAQLGLVGLERRYPATLSGGERQRTAIGRALALRPKVLLMDEPFSSLDTLTRERLQDALLDIRSDSGLTSVIVTHSIEEAAFLGDQVMVLGGRPCSIKAIIDNHGSGGRSYRDDERFFATCRKVRREVDRA